MSSWPAATWPRTRSRGRSSGAWAPRSYASTTALTGLSVRTVLADLAGLARAGHRLVFFPKAGSAPSRVCAGSSWSFVVAGEAGKPVLPVAVLGTWDLLPPGARLPRRHAVEVRFGETLGPPPPGWRVAHEIARQARGEIEALLGDEGL